MKVLIIETLKFKQLDNTTSTLFLQVKCTRIALGYIKPNEAEPEGHTLKEDPKIKAFDLIESGSELTYGRLVC